MNSRVLILLFTGALLLSSCQPYGKANVAPVSENHSTIAPAATASIPKPVFRSTALPVPQPQVKEPIHTVVVSDVPLRDLLFSLARDAKLNLDLDSTVSGKATLNAVKQPLPAILDRLAENNQLRYQIKHGVLRIQKDLPFIRNYQVDYLNLTRRAESDVSVSTQINATGQGAGEEGSSGGAGGNNNSSTHVKTSSEQLFWETLEKNIATILERGEAGEEAHPDIMLNRESGVMGIRATGRQHRQVQAFIDQVQASSQRQVLIEATIAEVRLSDSFQAGIDWNLLKQDVGQSWTADQVFTDLLLGDRPSFNLSFSDIDGNGNMLQATLSALETFGDVSVMSSPKIMAMNNQTALLKVVDNLVYFTVDVNIDAGSQGEGRLFTFESEIHTVPVGFVMGVTPYISKNGEVTLNVRPTISRVVGSALDPNPALAEAKVVNEIPVIQVREVESVLKVASGDTAVIGGLMQDEVNKSKRGIPFISRIPLLGNFFGYTDNQNEKTELVIFIKPLVVQQASVKTDLNQFNSFYQDAKSRLE
ncbi:MAG: pilus (MSHA type) biogenesis protein MshL [Cellvibrionaceae bacterium]|nr:pilus (MSHA type) biogenesis protein MshL [Cellvibrionaceae bacterium]